MRTYYGVNQNATPQNLACHATSLLNLRKVTDDPTSSTRSKTVSRPTSSRSFRFSSRIIPEMTAEKLEHGVSSY